MAYANMNVAPSYGNTQNHRQAYEYEVNLVAASTSEDILIPQDVNNLVVSMTIVGATGHVQLTTDTVATVKAGTATWFDEAVAGASKMATLKIVTAIHFTQVGAGSVKCTVRAQ